MEHSEVAFDTERKRKSYFLLCSKQKRLLGGSAEPLSLEGVWTAAILDLQEGQHPYSHASLCLLEL